MLFIFIHSFIRSFVHSFIRSSIHFIIVTFNSELLNIKGRPGSSRSRNASGTSKAKSAPWIPPGKASLKPASASSTNVAGHTKNVGFDAGEIRDEQNYGKVKKYESKIDSLMSEAGELQSQLELQKVRTDADR